MAQGKTEEHCPHLGIELGEEGAFQMGQHNQAIAAWRDSGCRAGQQVVNIPALLLGFAHQVPALARERLLDHSGFEMARAVGHDLHDRHVERAYTVSLERFDTFLRTELGIIFKTPLVMLKMAQGR